MGLHPGLGEQFFEKSEKSAWALVVNLSRNYFMENWFSPLPSYSKAFEIDIWSFCCKWKRFCNPAKSRKLDNSGREPCKVDLPRQYGKAVANIGYLGDLIPWFHLLVSIDAWKNPGQIQTTWSFHNENPMDPRPLLRRCFNPPPNCTLSTHLVHSKQRILGSIGNNAFQPSSHKSSQKHWQIKDGFRRPQIPSFFKRLVSVVNQMWFNYL